MLAIPGHFCTAREPVKMLRFIRHRLELVLVPGLALIAGVAVAAAPPPDESVGVYEPWSVLPEKFPDAILGAQPFVRPSGGSQVLLDTSKIRSQLAGAPHESLHDDVGVRAAPVVIALPKPDGSFERFEVFETSIMEPGLAAQFPDFKTYAGDSIDNPRSHAQIDITSLGFRAQILSASGSYWIDPVTMGDTNLYTSYHKSDLTPPDDWKCFVTDEFSREFGVPKQDNPFQNRSATGNVRRDFRLAVAATGEYTAFFGGTVANGQAAIVTAIDRVSGIYLQEFCVRLILIANNSSIVYTNAATDPYSNGSPSSLTSENQTNLTNVIGDANYDVGHVFSTAGGGQAALNAVCKSTRKARGETGLASPAGDAFYVDYVAHELGHQFGANHTFNTSRDSGNRHGATAYEPGSGSTIMAYAGIEQAENLQLHSDPYFHHASLDEVAAFLATIPDCGTSTITRQSAPSVNAGAEFTIPTNTPYTLTGSATDADGDPLTFCWEAYSLGPATLLTTPDNGTSPIQRSLLPVSQNFRQFPANANLVANTFMLGEKLPAVARVAPYFLTVRDGRGGVNSASTTVTAVDTGAAFQVTSPNNAVTWPGFSTQTVTWNVAGTTANGINCATVEILLSTDGGLSFPIKLVGGTPNSGSANIIVPNTATSSARISVNGDNNIFFDISDVDFTITSAVLPSIPTDPAATLPHVCAGGSSSLSVAAPPAGIVIDWYRGSCLGTFVATGNPIVVSPTTSTNYFARARRPADNAVSASCSSTTITVDTNPAPPASAGVNRNELCRNDSGNITLYVTGGSGTTLRWLTGSCAGALAGTGDGLSIASPLVTTTYFARWETACGVSTCTSVTVNVKACPADLNCDEQVDDSDFVIFLAAYNILDCNEMLPDCPADLNRDLGVDDADFVIFLGAYNELVCP